MERKSLRSCGYLEVSVLTVGWGVHSQIGGDDLPAAAALVDVIEDGVEELSSGDTSTCLHTLHLAQQPAVGVLVEALRLEYRHVVKTIPCKNVLYPLPTEYLLQLLQLLPGREWSGLVWEQVTQPAISAVVVQSRLPAMKELSVTRLPELVMVVQVAEAESQFHRAQVCSAEHLREQSPQLAVMYCYILLHNILARPSLIRVVHSDPSYHHLHYMTPFYACSHLVMPV